ncbi:MAG: TetR/AcrR family transcriptional regulator [Caulobacterales bacterium]|nr:TetR/AcrR family transcriptional regulator [Caulobacterales bacterium]
MPLGDDTPPPSSDDPRRDAILRLAKDRFMTDGYVGARMEPIAREAGVSTATLYGYFPGKAELFTAVIDDAAEDFSRQMSHVRMTSGPAREQLTVFVTAYADFMSDPFVRAVFRLVVAERPRFQTVAMRFFERGRSDFGGVLIKALRTLGDTGEVRVDRPSWAAGHLMGMIEHPVFFVPLVTGDDVRVRRTNAQVAEDAVETFLARYGV